MVLVPLHLSSSKSRVRALLAEGRTIEQAVTYARTHFEAPPEISDWTWPHA